MNFLMAGFVDKDGKILSSSGQPFKVDPVPAQAGKYIISFKPLRKNPIVVATSTGEDARFAVVGEVKDHQVLIVLMRWEGGGGGITLANCGFHFTIVESEH